MDKIICFGELLLRFSPEINSFENNSIPFYIGGAELNVAAALAKWNQPVAYCTVLPDNFMSHNICQYLDKKQIDISTILKVGDRIGTYYLTQGFDMTNAGVVYDRQGSSFSCIKKGQIDWKKSLYGVKWFHFSAIAASLTQNAAEVCLEALQMAHLMGIPISLDLNYRPQLWRYGVAPIETILPLMQYCDLVMGNIWSIEKLVGLKSSIASSEGASDLMLKNAALESINLLKERFPNLKSIALTFRLTNDYFAILHHADTTYCSSTYNLPKIVDKVGSGDCFMAGLLYGLNNYNNPQQTVDFAAKAAVGKLNELGDMTNQTIEMINQNN